MSADGYTKKHIGRYELQALVGEGGMGNVYRGLDTKTGRTVAIKVVNLPADEEVAAKLRLRFMREVAAVSRIEHPNVVHVQDYGFSDDNTPYLIMELLEGTDLGKVLRSSRALLPISYVVDVVLGVCAAVRACHAAWIVHRDLKPGNVFLAKTDAGPGWQVKVLDFGVAKSTVFGGNLTNLGQIVGTLQYISPEQVNGTALPASDQYAIGVLLYACLTKRLPFGGLKDIALLKAIGRGEFLPPRTHRPDLPDSLEAIILRAMSTDAADRFESVYALGQHLWPFASPLGRRSWERFYTATSPTGFSDDATGGDTNTDPADRAIDVAELPEDTSTTSADNGATVVAGYDATTVVGLDNAALIASFPTRIVATSSQGTGSVVAGGGSVSGKVVEPVSRLTVTAFRERSRAVVALTILFVLSAAVSGAILIRSRRPGPPRIPAAHSQISHESQQPEKPLPREFGSTLPIPAAGPVERPPTPRSDPGGAAARKGIPMHQPPTPRKMRRVPGPALDANGIGIPSR